MTLPRLGFRGWTALLMFVVLAVLLVVRPRFTQRLGLDPGERSAMMPAGGDFELAAGDGPWRLSEHAGDGSLVLLYFGFTRCPDLCPMTLGTIANALRELPEASRRRVSVVFVSVDHRFDTPASASAYAADFGPQFTGLTGDSLALARVTQQFNAAFAFVPLPGSAMRYTVDHTGLVYLLDRRGLVRDMVPTDEIVTTLRKRMEKFL
jgi:protein SCO1/2